MNKYEKGPWSLGEPEASETGGLFVPVHSPDHGELATVVWRMEDDNFDGLPSTSCEANARLIAAAPDLLDALDLARAELRRLMPMMQIDASGSGPDCTAFLQALINADAAAQKARGES